MLLGLYLIVNALKICIVLWELNNIGGDVRIMVYILFCVS